MSSLSEKMQNVFSVERSAIIIAARERAVPADIVQAFHNQHGAFFDRLNGRMQSQRQKADTLHA